MRGPSRSSSTGTDARPRLEPDLRELQGLPEHERGAERGMTGKRKLRNGREDANPRVPAGLGRKDEHGLRQVHLARDVLHRPVVEAAPVGEHGELVAGQRRVGEDVCEDVAVSAHALTLRGRGARHRRPLSLNCRSRRETYISVRGGSILLRRASLRRPSRRGCAGRAGRPPHPDAAREAAGARARPTLRAQGDQAGRRDLEPAASRPRDGRRNRDGGRRRGGAGRAPRARGQLRGRTRSRRGTRRDAS